MSWLILLRCLHLDGGRHAIERQNRRQTWPVVVNPRLSPRELDQIYAHSGARRLFTTTEISKEAAAHAARLHADLRQIGPFGGIGVSALNETTAPELVEA